MESGTAPRGGVARIFREPANSLTHLVGLLFAIVGSGALLALAAGDPWRTAALGVYGVSLVTLYTASTLLHAVRARAAILRRLRVFDHAAIFVFIAGTYTPVALLAVREVAPAWGWTLLALVWLLAAAGVAFKVLWIGAPRALSVGLYLALGWLAVLAAPPLLRALPTAALAWTVAGGLAYTVGAIVYARRRPDPWPRSFGFHALWHLFVLVGSACHFVMILYAAGFV